MGKSKTASKSNGVVGSAKSAIDGAVGKAKDVVKSAVAAPAPSKKSKTAKVPSPEPESDSSAESSAAEADTSVSSDSDSDSSVPEAAPKKTKAVPAKTAAPKDTPMADGDGSDDSDSSEPVPKKSAKAVPNGKTKAAKSSTEPVASKEDGKKAAAKSTTATATNGKAKSQSKSQTKSDAAPVPVKAAESSDSSDSSSDEDDDDKPTTKLGAINGALSKDDDEDDSSDEDDSADASDADEDSSDDSDDSDASEMVAPAKKEMASNKRKASEPAVTPGKKMKAADGAAKAVPAGLPENASTNLFIGRLSWDVDEEWLTREFEEFGEIQRVKIIMDRDTGKSKGFGYVEFAKVEDAVKALNAKHESELDGRQINVDYSNQQPKPANGGERGTARAQQYGDERSPPSSVLFVGNLSFDVDEDVVGVAFGEYGTVTSVRLPTDRYVQNYI